MKVKEITENKTFAVHAETPVEEKFLQRLRQSQEQGKGVRFIQPTDTFRRVDPEVLWFDLKD